MYMSYSSINCQWLLDQMVLLLPKVKGGALDDVSLVRGLLVGELCILYVWRKRSQYHLI